MRPRMGKAWILLTVLTMPGMVQAQVAMPGPEVPLSEPPPEYRPISQFPYPASIMKMEPLPPPYQGANPQTQLPPLTGADRSVFPKPPGTVLPGYSKGAYAAIPEVDRIQPTAFAAPGLADPAEPHVLPPPRIDTGIPVAPARILSDPPPKAVIPRIWGGNLETGLSGADGNSNNHKLRVGGEIRRETPNCLTKVDFLYRYANINSTPSENRSLTNLRQEWPLTTSPWSVFLTGQAETDEFANYDLRLSGHTGIGYKFWKTPTSFLKSRLGVGGSQKFGSPDNEFRPEALFGLDLEHQIAKRHKVCATIDYFPDMTHFSEFRVQAKAVYDILIDPDWNLTLRLGVLDRYDSNPAGAKPNDIEYFATLLWKF